MKTLITLVVAFLVLSLFFSIVESVAPSIRGQRRWRSGFRTDVVYWLFTPIVTKAIAKGAVILAIVALAVAFGHAHDRAGVTAFAHGRSVLAGQPRWLQLALLLLAADFFAYWTHRLFHRRALWRFHAVHHSSKELDWLSSVRVHPVNDAASKVLTLVPLVLLGFDPTLAAAALPILTFYAIFVHANVYFDFGPLKYVIATPAFHRWHHTSEAEGLDTNFAGLFPIFDLVFGTFYMPKHKHATHFGIRDNDMPEGLFGQLLYPFRRRP
jgi:sterol desaturase/sphingolipid hydroxylase (fatty acid hydroxylase superfamily)